MVLDWLVFGNPAVAPLFDAVTQGRVHWLVTVAMRDEFEHVLGRGLAAARNADIERLRAAWDAHAQPRPAAAVAQRLRCTDTDDQKFIDLAVAARCRWLLSRDKAVLRLARRASALGLSILTPERWAEAQLPNSG